MIDREHHSEIEGYYEEDGSIVWGIINGILITLGVAALMALAVYA